MNRVTTNLSRPGTVNVLNRRFVAPADHILGDAHSRGDLVAFGGTRSPPSHLNGHHAHLLQTGFFYQLLDGHTLLLTEFGNAEYLLSHFNPHL